VEVGNTAHWGHVPDEGSGILSRKVPATEEDIKAGYSAIAGLGSAKERIFCIDTSDGPATLLEAVLPDAAPEIIVTGFGLLCFAD
jgi:hypothetical protein